MAVKHEFKSCYQCVALHQCFPFQKPDKEKAKEIAAFCVKPYMGLATDIIIVYGRSRGMSRKKAFKLSRKKRVRWISKDKVALNRG